jgi:uncharacterized protein (TIRG00374 family)
MQNQTELYHSPSGPPLWRWPTYASIAAALLILCGLLARIDMQAVWRQIATCNKAFIVLGGLAHYATYAVRGMRWRRCLAHLTSRAGWGKYSLLVFFYNAVDNIIPAKLADVYAAHLARINCGVPRAAAMGSIVFLRMLDAWWVLFLAVFASWVLFAASLPRAVLWSLILGALIALGVTGIILVSMLCRRALPSWLPASVQNRLRAFHLGMWPKLSQIGPIALLTAIIWTLETLWVVSLTWAFHLAVNPMEGIFLTTIPILASAFPLTPSGMGVVELTLFSCLHLIGVPTPVAASLTVVNRLVDHLLHIALGATIWALRHVVGLRTWRETPLEMNDLRGAASPGLSVT